MNPEVPSPADELFRKPGEKTTVPLIQRKPSSFHLLPATDSSVLLGNRYLNRGDGLVISGQSGCGKSSMQMQMAERWALGQDFFGIRPPVPLSSLIIQSEDSDGDIAEVLASQHHVRQHTPDQIAQLDQRIRIVTDRTNRGIRFIASLKAHIAEFKPDLVWINPLQAFIDGDVTASKDIGQFLREGLNGLNEPASFGYVLIHHTTKPATGKDRHERLWHEQMYDMAGGAEIINWARAIISIKPMDNPGEYTLRLAKRGRRAGVVKMVEQGVGLRPEPVTEIGVKHSTGKLSTGQPIIFWEPMDITPTEEAKSPAGRRQKYVATDFSVIWPVGQSKAMGFRALHRYAVEIKPTIGRGAFENILLDAMNSGELVIDKSNPRQPKYYAPEGKTAPVVSSPDDPTTLPPWDGDSGS